MISTTMKPTTLSVTKERVETATEKALLKSRSKWLACLFFCGTSGFFSGFFGLGLSALVLAGVLQKDSVDPAITILLVALYPLLLLSAHSLDRIREAETRVKLEYCKRLGTLKAPDRSTERK